MISSSNKNDFNVTLYITRNLRRNSFVNNKFILLIYKTVEIGEEKLFFDTFIH